MKEEVLRVEKIVQKKNGNLVLNNINFQIFKGEIMGMIFLSSQGKEELIELLRENTPVDYGRVFLQEKLVNSYANHLKTGSNMIPVIGQDSGLIKTLSVADNIFVMRKGLKKYILNRKLLRNQFYFWFEELGISINPDSLVSDLSKLECCIVELFRAVVAGSKIIIVKDIASTLSDADLQSFYSLMRYFRKDGISFLYMGNHHEEVFRICNRVALMKNAEVIRILKEDELIEKNIRPYAISFDIQGSEMSENEEKGILDFQEVTTKYMKKISFSIKKGECVLFVDTGNEMLKEFIALLCEGKSPDSGKIYYDGKLFDKSISAKWVKNKILLIPENPTKKLIFWNLTYLENLCFLLDQKMKHVPLEKHLEESIIAEYKDYVGNEIYEEDLRNLDVNSLYNLIYYRVHLFNPKIVICIQPFAGLDMYARRHVVDLLYFLQTKGITIIIWSVNLADCLSVANRLIYLQEGQIKRVYEKDEFYHFKEKG